MVLRKEVTKAMGKHAPIPVGKEDPQRDDYYARYEDNLFCPLGLQAQKAYHNGRGAETRPKVKIVKGETRITPAKMASIASSSAMTFNLLGNGAARIVTGDCLPRGIYEVQYEKQMYPLKKGRAPANLDAFLESEEQKTAIFCEMKLLEWLGEPSLLRQAYLENGNYFKGDAFEDVPRAFGELMKQWIDEKKIRTAGYGSRFKRYDAWQMLKHLLAIYNYTSFATQQEVNAFSNISSMAGKYDYIVLANVVNEFPPHLVEDAEVQKAYREAIEEERREAQAFIEGIEQSEIPALFKNHCKAKLEVKYLSAKAFADSLAMSDAQRNYLKRYF